MNPSEEVIEMAELYFSFGDYCFAYIDEDLTVQVSTKGVEPLDLVSAFVSYMKAVGFDPEAIEFALANQSQIMRSFRLPGIILDPKE